MIWQEVVGNRAVLSLACSGKEVQKWKGILAPKLIIFLDSLHSRTLLCDSLVLLRLQSPLEAGRAVRCNGQMLITDLRTCK